MNARLSGVMPAVTTPFTYDREVNIPLLVDRCKWLLENGCDGINLLGTTGEGTSLSSAQRLQVMSQLSRADLPLDRLMVSTGSPSLEEAQLLTHTAVELGFGGVLLLPPYYFKGVSEDGIVNFIDHVLRKVDKARCRLYLYHMPAYTGIPYTPSIALKLKELHGNVIAGLKDSTGDLSVSSAFVNSVPEFDVFPSAEGSLAHAKARGFAGCISATVNVTAPLCGRFWRGEEGGLDTLMVASEIRKSLQAQPLLAAVKWAVAKTTGDARWEIALPPITPLSEQQIAELEPVLQKYWDSIRA